LDGVQGVTTLAEYRASRELFNNLTLRELRSKYKRSVLGWAWSMLNPISTLVIFTVVFSLILKVQAPPGQPSGLHLFALYLLCALLPFSYFQNSVMGCIGCLVNNGNLIKKTYFPRELLPAANVGSNLVSHLIELGLLLVALILFGNVRALLYIPVVIVLVVLLSVFSLGLGLALSVLNVYFRDIQHLMGILMTVWFYLTPIVYPITLVPIEGRVFGLLLPVRSMLRLNPMTEFAECFRSAWYDLRMPPTGDFLYLAFASVAVFFIGLFVFGKLEGNLAEEL
jgi:ABC-type polysaccharide/polyol phosphate export permease